MRDDMPDGMHNDGGLGLFMLNGRSCSIDLASGEVEEHEMSEESLRGGTPTLVEARRLASEHDGAALVFGAGLLTGSLVPAACTGFVLSPTDEVVPLTGSFGAEIKLSGFDIVVVKGRAPGPGYLWVRDGIAEFVPSPELRALDSWQRTDRIRSDQGDRRIQVVSVGRWGDAGLPSSQLVMDYWGGEDKVGCAGAMGDMNLAAVAFRGMGEVELADPEGHFAASVKVIAEHRDALGRSDGLASYSEVAAQDGYRQLLHRSPGCYGCPFPCRSFYKIFEDPGAMALGAEEPGYLAYDTLALEAMPPGISPRDAVSMLIHCAKAGAEPLAALSLFGKDHAETTPEALRDFLAGPLPAREEVVQERGGMFDASGMPTEDIERYVGLGLCPRFWARVGKGRPDLKESVETALGDCDVGL